MSPEALSLVREVVLLLHCCLSIPEPVSVRDTIAPTFDRPGMSAWIERKDDKWTIYLTPEGARNIRNGVKRPKDIAAHELCHVLDVDVYNRWGMLSNKNRAKAHAKINECAANTVQKRDAWVRRQRTKRMTVLRRVEPCSIVVSEKA